MPKKTRRGRPPVYQTQEPPHESTEVPELEHQGVDARWPESLPMPTHASRTLKTPCPNCRRVSGKSGQAALKMRSGHNVTYMRCRYCDHRWSLQTQ